MKFSWFEGGSLSPPTDQSATTMATDSRDFGSGHAHDYLQLYLRALMELEGVLGLVVMLHELVRSMRMFVGLYNTSQKSQRKKSLFCEKTGFYVRAHTLLSVFCIPRPLVCPEIGDADVKIGSK